MRIGIVVNPIAGMGGRVGLKGTDGKVAAARDRGAEPRAPERARRAIESFAEHAPPETTVLAAGAPMGADLAREGGLDVEAVTDPPEDRYATTAADTREAVRTFLDREVDLVLFAGGDGTAVDVATTVADHDPDAATHSNRRSGDDSEETGRERADRGEDGREESGQGTDRRERVGREGDGDGEDGDRETPILGIPAGVKIYSGVFGATPAAAGRIAASFEGTVRREVNDVDEDAVEEGRVETDLRAIARVPVAEDVQSTKQISGGDAEGLVEGVAEDVRSRPGVAHVFGPGSTVGAIERALGVDGTPLGVDVYRDGRLVVRDGTAGEVTAALGEENVIVVSPIGGQGFIFGRGNQQITPETIGRSTVEVVADRQKLDRTGVLRVDTGDPDLDDRLRGWRKVRVGRFERRMVKVV